MTHILALLGVLAISFSAVFIRLAAVSPVTAVFYRAAYAVPVLAALWTLSRADDHRGRAARVLALVSGIILSFDLGFWHESIALIGAGLGTVIANIQVVFVAAAGWVLYKERPSASTFGIIAAVLAGIALTSGFARPDAYGANPVLGVALGAAAGACYAGFLMTFRAANRLRGPTSGPLLDATIGTAIGALLISPLDPHFALAPTWPAHGWLIALALVAQVAGWLLIATALPRLPAVETSILLLGQPVFAVIWGQIIFGEHLSPIQWIGTALVLAGVASISRRAPGTDSRP
jgi:drug/metabolite transporter (DMT)-like permease